MAAQIPSPSAGGEPTEESLRYQQIILASDFQSLQSKTPGFGVAWAGLTAPTGTVAGLRARRGLCESYGWTPQP